MNQELNSCAESSREEALAREIQTKAVSCHTKKIISLKSDCECVRMVPPVADLCQEAHRSPPNHLSPQRAYVSEIVASAFKVDHILSTNRPLCQVMCQIGPTWTGDLFEIVLERNMRIFYYDLAWGTIEEAEQTIQNLEDARARFSTRIDVPVITSLLFGIQERDRRIGKFGNPERRQIMLRKGDRFIVSADRRMLQRGSRVAVYCNFVGIIGQLTPNSFIYIGEKVALRIQKIVNVSVVCTVEEEGPIRPLDNVRMPLSTSDTVINQEGIDEINLAIRHNALAIVTKSPRNSQYFASLASYINTNSTKPLHILSMTRTSDLRGPTQEQFISKTYHGVIHQIHDRHCPNLRDEPIEPTCHELEMIRHLFEQRKPFYVVAYLGDSNVIALPMVSPKHSEVLHYFSDGFLLPTTDKLTFHSLCQFLNHLVSLQSIDSNISVHKLLHNPLVDLTRSGRRTLFRDAALASFSLKAQAILLHTKTGRSAIEMAQFRPACQIFAITDKMRLNMFLCKSMLYTYSGSILAAPDLAPDRSDLNAWRLWQRIQLLSSILRNMRKRLLLLTDRIIVLSKSGPDVNFLNTFDTSTVAEFLARSEECFGLSAGMFGENNQGREKEHEYLSCDCT